MLLYKTFGVKNAVTTYAYQPLHCYEELHAHTQLLEKNILQYIYFIVL